MKRLVIIYFLLCSLAAKAQREQAVANEWRQHYKEEFLTDAHSPLKAEDTGSIRFFDFNPLAVVAAQLKRTPDAKPFMMTTHSGKTKLYREYGVLTLASVSHSRLSGGQQKKFKLHIYQGLELLKDSTYRDYLFLPFTDATNGVTTYGGGRYIDLKTTDFKNDRAIVDFNRAYNPYCAFREGYNCPIPPRENSLPFSINAGEMIYAKAPKE